LASETDIVGLVAEVRFVPKTEKRPHDLQSGFGWFSLPPYR
jgi:hypothetical protein